MNIGNAFPSRFLKAADLQGRAVRVTISDVVVEDIGDGEKPVLYMAGKQKGVVLNRTNASVIADTYGEMTEGWQGNELELYPDKTQFQGRIVDCLRVRIPVASEPVAPPPPPPAPAANEMDDIPF